MGVDRDDFDGDGKQEAFLLLGTPSFDWLSDREEFAVFVNSSGAAQLLCNGVGAYFEPIRYNGFMHMGISFGVLALFTVTTVRFPSRLLAKAKVSLVSVSSS